MIHLINILYVVQLLFDVINCKKIFADLKSIFFNKFSWFVDADDSFDEMESKIRGTASSKDINSDIITLLTICALLFALAIVSASCSNNDINFAFNHIDTNAADVLENTTLAHSGSNIACSNYINPNEEFISSRASCKSSHLNIDVPFPSNSPQTSSTEIVSFPNSQLNVNAQQHSQKTQTSKRFLQRLEKSHEWLLRCTRSGQVYGKYPL